MTYIFWKLVFDVVSNTIFSFNFDEYKINTNFIGEEEQSEDDDDYYYHGEDGTSELDAQTVTSADPDEYYDYQVRSTYHLPGALVKDEPVKPRLSLGTLTF